MGSCSSSPVAVEPANSPPSSSPPHKTPSPSPSSPLVTKQSNAPAAVLPTGPSVISTTVVATVSSPTPPSGALAEGLSSSTSQSNSTFTGKNNTNNTNNANNTNGIVEREKESKKENTNNNTDSSSSTHHSAHLVPPATATSSPVTHAANNPSPPSSSPNADRNGANNNNLLSPSNSNSNSSSSSDTNSSNGNSSGSSTGSAPINGNTPSQGQGSAMVKEARKAMADMSCHVDTYEDHYFSVDEEKEWEGNTMNKNPIGNNNNLTGKGNTTPEKRPLSPDTTAGTLTNTTTLHPSSPSLSVDEALLPLSAASTARFHWKKGQLLGSGSYGRVYLGLDQQTGNLLAVKEISLSPYDPNAKPGAVPATPQQQQRRFAKLQREIHILRNMNSPYIVQYKGVALEGDLLHIFLEYVPGGSIASLLKKFGSFSEHLVRIYTRQILYGLEYLHKNRCIHRDIKGGNILIDCNSRVKIADFGASIGLSEFSKEKPTIEGTPYWMAPEVIKQQPHGRKVDVWSLACSMIEMLTGKPPWSQFKTQISALYHIGSTHDPPELPTNISEDCRDFILWCLERDQEKRPNVIKLLQHPFITNESGSISGMGGEGMEGNGNVEGSGRKVAIRENLSLAGNISETAMGIGESTETEDERKERKELAKKRPTKSVAVSGGLSDDEVAGGKQKKDIDDFLKKQQDDLINGIMDEEFVAKMKEAMAPLFT